MWSVPRPLVLFYIRKMMETRPWVEKPVDEHRREFIRVALPKPFGITCKVVAEGKLTGEWLTPKRPQKRGVILYLHGGAYRFGSCVTHREFAGRLARLTQLRVFVSEYRLAPEHPFPAAHDDAVAAYQGLLDAGFSATEIIVAGDSAGGGLALSLALGLRARKLPQPAGLVLLSPWVDLALAGDTLDSNAACDPMLDAVALRYAVRDYVAGGDPRNPLISPLYGDLAGLPPIMIQVGTDEILLSDSIRLAAAAEKAGVPVEMEVWQGMWHVWQLFALVEPDARAAQRKIAAFVQRRLEATDAMRAPRNPSQCTNDNG